MSDNKDKNKLKKIVKNAASTQLLELWKSHRKIKHIAYPDLKLQPNIASKLIKQKYRKTCFAMLQISEGSSIRLSAKMSDEILNQAEVAKQFVNLMNKREKSRIWETKHLSTDADRSTNTTIGLTKNTQKPNFFLKTEKIIQNAKTQKCLEICKN